MEPAPSPFRTWNDVEAHELFPGVRLHAIGGEQVLVCRVTYEPGTTVARHHHDATEQIVVMTDGEMTLTIGDSERHLVAGDVAVVNRVCPTSCTPRRDAPSSRPSHRCPAITSPISSATWSWANRDRPCTWSADPVPSATGSAGRGTEALDSGPRPESGAGSRIGVRDMPSPE